MDVVNQMFQGILPVISNQINVNLVIGVVVGSISASVGLVFMWWGVRKLIFVIMNAFRSGKLDISGSTDKGFYSTLHGKNLSESERDYYASKYNFGG